MANMSAPIFSFHPRWKEELVCSCSLGAFVLEMPMGVTSVYMPTEERWPTVAPEWARPHWKTLHSQLEAWCSAQRIPLYLDNTTQPYAP